MSGSPGASDEANRVVYACLAALDLLEAGGEPLREKYPATGGLAAAFYGALRAVHGPRAGRPRLAYLLACAEAARRALEDLREKRSNFFGAEFRDRSPLSTLKNVERKVRQLTASSSEASSADARAAASYAGGALGDDDAEATIADVPTRLLWIERFGRYSTEVPWRQFARAVVDEFGEQPRGTVDALRPALGVTARNEFVSMARLGRFASRGGFYAAFVALSDPARVVYAMGTVDDDANGGDASPQLVEGLLGLPVASVCCGGQHAAVLTRDGDVYTWGRGGFGRLGHGDVRSLKAPRLVRGGLAGVVCAQVACGFAYTAAVSRDGALYTWGAGENGRLGLGDVDDRHEPSLVEALWPRRPLRRVNAGSVHTCALGVDGVAYSFGKHEYTGHGAAADVLAPRPLAGAFGGRAVREISVGPGGYHTVALVSPSAAVWQSTSASDSPGTFFLRDARRVRAPRPWFLPRSDVYTWGHNRVGQLGYSNSEVVPRNVEGAYFLPKPQLVESLRRVNVKQVVAGWGHSAVLTAQGQVFICGRNYQGQLGLGDPDGFPQNERGHPYQAKFCTVEELEQKHVMQIACGGEHSVALLKNGEVYTFGAGNKGQLGHGSTNNEYFPQVLCSLKASRRLVHQVACGNNCTLILAGSFNPPSLLARCMEVLREDPELMASMEARLPAELVSEVRHYPDMSQPPLPAS